MKILITGGAGYIGTHTCVELLNNGFEIVVVDNFYNSNISAIENVKKITGKQFDFYEIDILDSIRLEEIFSKHNIDAVIHFAGYKAVGESVAIPLTYYTNNVVATVNLLKVMEKHNVFNIVFSSSASVYGEKTMMPLTELTSKSPTNPYSRSKSIIEDIIIDVCISNPKWSASILRYFNPVGAHESGLIGEKPNGIPNNLMPYIMMVAKNELPFLNIFGVDYDTIDGSGVRDYIHVEDLAIGHIKALQRVFEIGGYEIFNLGTGQGTSVLQLVKAFEETTGIKIEYKIVDRRPGDIANCWADTKKAEEYLNWKAQKNILEMCESGWNFYKRGN